MGLLNWLGISKPRDAPMLPNIQDNVRDSGNLFVFGMTHSGERVDERTAMQIVTVYACVRLLSNTIAGLPLHLYRYTGEAYESPLCLQTEEGALKVEMPWAEEANDGFKY